MNSQEDAFTENRVYGMILANGMNVIAEKTDSPIGPIWRNVVMLHNCGNQIEDGVMNISLGMTPIFLYAHDGIFNFVGQNQVIFTYRPTDAVCSEYEKLCEKLWGNVASDGHLAGEFE